MNNYNEGFKTKQRLPLIIRPICFAIASPNFSSLCYRILLLATRQKLELTITALLDHFCNPQLHQQVLIFQNFIFDFKTDNQKFFQSFCKQRPWKPIRIQNFRNLLQLMHMQRMRLLNTLWLTEKKRVAKQYYLLLRRHVQLNLSASPSKKALLVTCQIDRAT